MYCGWSTSHRKPSKNNHDTVRSCIQRSKDGTITTWQVEQRPYKCRPCAHNVSVYEWCGGHTHTRTHTHTHKPHTHDTPRTCATMSDGLDATSTCSVAMTSPVAFCSGCGILKNCTLCAVTFTKSLSQMLHRKSMDCVAVRNSPNVWNTLGEPQKVRRFHPGLHCDKQRTRWGQHALWQARNTRRDQRPLPHERLHRQQQRDRQHERCGANHTRQSTPLASIIGIALPLP
jgi:hypothetical protein